MTTWNLSLFTACAPWLPLSQLAPHCVSAGLQGFDLAVKSHAFDTAQPFNFWNNNAAVLPSQDLAARAAEASCILRQHGLKCRVLSSYIQPTELDEARRLAMAANSLQAPLVRIWSPRPEPGQARAQVAAAQAAWRELAAIADAYGVRFVLELHDHTITTGASGALRLLDGLDPARVGVILDIANAASEGNEPLALAVDLLGPYLAHVHVKDLAFRPGAAWNGLESGCVELGQGTIRWPLCLRILREAGYNGWLAIENFTGMERGPERIVADAAWLRATIEESHRA